jgi:hypothetical protein
MVSPHPGGCAYSGAPSHHLKSLTAVIRERLNANSRCLYLNSPAMVAGIRSCLAAEGMDVAGEIAKSRLQLSSGQGHLVNGMFDSKRVLELLREALASALPDGHAGLSASGDTAWEFGPEKNLANLLEYECDLEDFLNAEPAFCGICQSPVDTFARGGDPEWPCAASRAVHQ